MTYIFAFGAAVVLLFGTPPPTAEEAIKGLEEIRDQACACKEKDGDEKKACIEKAKASARAWGSTFKDTRGGDQEKAAEVARELTMCSTEVGLALVEGHSK